MRFPWRKSEVDDPTSHEGVTQLDISTTTTTSIEEASPGCCHYLLQSSVNVIHLLELLFGLVLFGYGILLALPHIRSDDDIDAASHHSATVIILLWSTLLIISSTAAVFSLTSPSLKRIGLILSAYVAILIAVWNFVVVMVLLIGIHHLADYLKAHEKALYLSDGEVENLKNNYLWYALLLVLSAFLEVWRFRTLPKIRSGLLRYDDARQFQIELDENRRTAEATRVWEGTPGKEDTMKTPLLSDADRQENVLDRPDEDKSNDEFTAAQSGAWWEDPLESNADRHENVWNKPDENESNDEVTATESGAWWEDP